MSTTDQNKRPIQVEKKKEVTLEEHEEKKRKRLDKLKQQNKQDKRLFEELGQKTRQAQLDKARKLTESNPLQIDEEELYRKNMAKIKRKYMYQRK